MGHPKAFLGADLRRVAARSILGRLQIGSTSGRQILKWGRE
jgi:hypothetical protein